jgi:hypothetical protein
MHTKETCLQKYEECKVSKNGGIPKHREFLKYAGIDDRLLEKLFGSSAYSKLQNAAGDTPNILQLERTPIATIMQQYGGLVIELGTVPAYAEWNHRELRPTESGLSKTHNMKWSEMPEKFVQWVRTNGISGFEKAIEIIRNSARAGTKNHENDDAFSRG